MSKSKTVMAGKLCNVQKRLMEQNIESSQVHVLIPLIFKECLKENMTFWFSFLEDCAILNLRDINHENYELNIRYHYPSAPISAERIDALKSELLMNVFLITKEATKIENIAASKKPIQKEDGTKIQESNMVPPTSIRTVMSMLEKNNEPITKKNIERYLQMDKMSTDNRRRCIAYLRQMEA